MSDRLAEIRARLDAATPGPWEERAQDDSRCMAYSSIWAVAPGRPAVEIVATDWNDDGYPQPVQADCDLIAHAPADIAYLLEQLAAANERADAAEAALRLADDVVGITKRGMTITGDCGGACEHPACLILRAIATYRKARATLASAGPDDAQAGGEVDA